MNAARWPDLNTIDPDLRKRLTASLGALMAAGPTVTAAALLSHIVAYSDLEIFLGFIDEEIWRLGIDRHRSFCRDSHRVLVSAANDNAKKRRR